jgi:hypothetical protein
MEKEKLTQGQREKLEACIRNDIENMPYKYRDLRDMFYGGMSAYKDWSGSEIEEYFNDYELEVTDDDKDWAKISL